MLLHGRAGVQDWGREAGSVQGCRISAALRAQGEHPLHLPHGRSCRSRRGWQLWDKVQPWQAGERTEQNVTGYSESFVTSVGS